ncbi:MAG: hypothetical protein WB699_11510 [Bacteroidota bacterium]
MRNGSKTFIAACYILVGVLVVECFPALVFAQGDLAVRNVRFEIAGELVRVYYDLDGASDKLYRVSITLKRQSDPQFSATPTHVSGDLGSIVLPGEKRRVTWDFLKDFPAGLQGNDYYFVVEAEGPPSEGLSPWVWVGGGAFVLGGLIALLAKGGTTTPPIPPDNFPTPPERP